MSTNSEIREITVTHPIHCVYFYHVKFGHGRKPRVSAYYHADDNDRIRDEVDLRQVVKKLALNAKAPDFVPPPCGRRFDAVPWRRRSYIVIFVEGDGRELSGPSDVRIEFKGGSERYNHSFFNASLMEVDLSPDNSGNSIGVFHCINLMRHVDERDIRDGEAENYQIVLFPDTARMVRFDDDGGTNQGGPIPPVIGEQEAEDEEEEEAECA